MTKVSLMWLSLLRPSLHQHGGGLRRAERCLILRQQLRDRGGGDVEDRFREDAEQNGQRGERPERDHLAIVEILDRGELRLGEVTEDHLAIEPKRVTC